MAPSLTDFHFAYSEGPPKHRPAAIFPDGIRTSGQHPPLYEELHPFEDFPEELTGPTVWKAADYVNASEQWIHPFAEEELAEMSHAADAFIASGAPLTGISKV